MKSYGKKFPWTSVVKATVILVSEGKLAIENERRRSDNAVRSEKVMTQKEGYLSGI